MQGHTHCIQQRQSLQFQRTRSATTALVKRPKVHIKHRHYRSHSFSSSLLMWQEEQKQSPLEQLQFPVTTRHRSNLKKKKKERKKKERGRGKRRKGEEKLELAISHTQQTEHLNEVFHNTHNTGCYLQWNLQCVNASTSVTYSKEISFIFLPSFTVLRLDSS